MCFLCCTIRSVNANLEELLLLFENDKNSNLLDIIILTETWHDDNYFNISYRDVITISIILNVKEIKMVE